MPVRITGSFKELFIFGIISNPFKVEENKVYPFHSLLKTVT